MGAGAGVTGDGAVRIGVIHIGAVRIGVVPIGAVRTRMAGAVAAAGAAAGGKLQLGQLITVSWPRPKDKRPSTFEPGGGPFDISGSTGLCPD